MPDPFGGGQPFSEGKFEIDLSDGKTDASAAVEAAVAWPYHPRLALDAPPSRAICGVPFSVLVSVTQQGMSLDPSLFEVKLVGTTSCVEQRCAVVTAHNGGTCCVRL